MKIIYCSCILSKPFYLELFDNSKIKPTIQGIKYNRLIAEGLSFAGADVFVYSAIQMSRRMNKKFVWKAKKEKSEGLTYHYLFFLNFLILRQITLFISSFISVLFFKGNRKDTIIVGDILSSAVAFGSLFAGRIRRFKYVAVVTDLPQFQAKKSISSPVIKMFRNFLKDNKDGYILVSDFMKDKISNLTKYIVIESIVDIDKNEVDPSKYSNKIVCYTGSLNKQYGLLKLIQAFDSININNAELWIFGKGDLEEYLYSLNNDKIKYYGMERNDKIVEIQKKSTLLVNPRPSNLPFSKYSFPSKTTEYMQSGTPVLTTRIAGIPDEYNEYLLFFDDESVAGISHSIQDILTRSDQISIINKGISAKSFVNERKNKHFQGHVIYDFLDSVIKG